VPPTTVPEMLTGEFTPDAAEHWQPEWGEDGDRHVDFGGAPQPRHNRNGGFDAEGRPRLDQTATRLRTLREHFLERSGPTLVTRATELSRCTFSICSMRMAIFALVSTG